MADNEDIERGVNARLFQASEKGVTIGRKEVEVQVTLYVDEYDRAYLDRYAEVYQAAYRDALDGGDNIDDAAQKAEAIALEQASNYAEGRAEADDQHRGEPSKS